MTDDAIDVLDLEIERADVLCEHIAERVKDLDGMEAYALSLIATDLRTRLALIGKTAKAAIDAAGGAK